MPLTTSQILLHIFITAFSICVAMLFIYKQIQPEKDEQQAKGGGATKEKIDELFDTVDPFDLTELQGSCDN